MASLPSFRRQDPKEARVDGLMLADGLSTRQVRRLAAMLDEVRADAGQLIADRGRLRRHLYFVASGDVRQLPADPRRPGRPGYRVLTPARLFVLDVRMLDAAIAISPWLDRMAAGGLPTVIDARSAEPWSPRPLVRWRAL